MVGWRDYFKYDVISEARYMLVSIVEQNDYEIEACINGEYKVRALMFYKTPYMLIVGEKEMNDHSLAVRQHGQVDLGTMPIADFVEHINQKIKQELSEF